MIKVEGSGSERERIKGNSKFVKLKMNGLPKKLFLWTVVNPWGIKNEEDKIKEKIFVKIADEKNGLGFYVKCSDVEIIGPFIAGYPSIRFGSGMFSPSSGLDLGKPKDYKKMLVSAEWDFNVTGFANLAFDIWLTKEKKGRLDDNDLEIMVWLDYNFGLPYQKVGENENFVIKYHKKSKEEAGSHSHWITFLAKEKSGKNQFDLLELINLCKKKIKNIDNYYIRSIELGTEFSKKTEVKALVKKLNFDFELKKLK